MVEPESEAKFSVWQIFRPGVNPKYKNLVSKKFQTLKTMFDSLRTELPEELFKIHKQKLDAILKEHDRAEKKLLSYLQSFKTYTADSQNALERLEHELSALVKKCQYLLDLFQKQPQELYVLQIISLWDSFYESLQNIFYIIEHPKFYHLLVAIFGFSFVLIPFLNFLSLIMGLFLVTKKDWRNILIGWIIIGIFIAQVFNILLLPF